MARIMFEDHIYDAEELKTNFDGSVQAYRVSRIFGVNFWACPSWKVVEEKFDFGHSSHGFSMVCSVGQPRSRT
jgi:hypothetical protein